MRTLKSTQQEIINPESAHLSLDQNQRVMRAQLRVEIQTKGIISCLHSSKHTFHHSERGGSIILCVVQNPLFIVRLFSLANYKRRLFFYCVFTASRSSKRESHSSLFS